MSSFKKVGRVREDAPMHWVGDGLPVRTMFSYHDDDAVDPFLLLDYAAPARFGPGDRPRGVGEHPHRGFETVTLVFQGELEHRDSGGNHGTIGPGDVQWMTAASGVVHEEFHSQAFTRSGGVLEMVQLWVNLPAQFKMSEPRYQEIRDARIPTVDLDGGAGSLRVIAGQFAAAQGPAKTFTPVHLWDLHLHADRSVDLPVPDGYTTALLVREGSVIINDAESVDGIGLALFDRRGDGIRINCQKEARALLLCGQPLGEPIVGQGPFVMNTRDEIRQAITDYQDGRMGTLAST